MSKTIKPSQPLPAPNLPLHLKVLLNAWHDWQFIVGITAFCTLAAVIVSFLLPKTYESSVPVVLLPPTFKEKNDIAGLMPRVFRVSDYEILVTSDSVLMEAVEKVKKLGTWSEEELADLGRISALRKNMRAEVAETEKTVVGVEYSPAILLYARADTPEHARDLAQAWAEVAIELTTSLYEKGKTGIKGFLGDRFEAVEMELGDAKGKIRDLDIEWNDKVEETRLANYVDRYLKYDEKIMDTEIEIQSYEREITSLEESLKEEPERLVLWKSPPETAMFLQHNSAALDAAPAAAERAAGYREEVLNSIHMGLKEKLRTRKTDLAQRIAYRQYMQDSMTDLRKEIDDQRAKVANKTFDRSMLSHRLTPLEETYNLVATRLEQAKIAESQQTNMPDIKLVANAVVPDKKIRPMRTLLVLAAMTMSFAMAFAVSFLRNELREIMEKQS